MKHGYPIKFFNHLMYFKIQISFNLLINQETYQR